MPKVGVVLALGDVSREGLAAVAVGGAVRQTQPGPDGAAFLLPPGDDLRQEGVGAGGVVRRVGQRQDGLVLANGEAFDGAEGGVGQLGAQALDGGGAVSVVALGGVVDAFFGEEGELLGHLG